MRNERAKGTVLSVIGNNLGRRSSVVGKWLARDELNAKALSQLYKLSVEQVRHIIKLWRAGASLRDMAVEVGIPELATQHILRKELDHLSRDLNFKRSGLNHGIPVDPPVESLKRPIPQRDIIPCMGCKTLFLSDDRRMNRFCLKCKQKQRINDGPVEHALHL
jgi:hypothetical protein